MHVLHVKQRTKKNNGYFSQIIKMHNVCQQIAYFTWYNYREIQSSFCL